MGRCLRLRWPQRCEVGSWRAQLGTSEMGLRKREELRQLRISLNGIFFFVWMVSSWVLSEEWRTQPSQSRLSLIKATAVRYPTVLVCNPLHYFNLASKSSCNDELGPHGEEHFFPADYASFRPGSSGNT